MTPAVKLFFPLLLLSTLLKAGETDHSLLIRSLQAYCLQAQDPEERQAFEIRLAKIQSALAYYRAGSNNGSVFSDPDILSLQNEISSLFNERKWFTDRELSHDLIVYPDRDNGNDHHFQPENSNFFSENIAIARSISVPEINSPDLRPDNRNNRLQNGSRAVTLPAYPF